jgi:DNA-binding CsgD family transcriptional regulator
LDSWPLTPGTLVEDSERCGGQNDRMGELFVGRRHELGVLTRHLTDLPAGAGGAVLVMGEAGIGKSTLVEQFQRRVVPAGVPVFSGRAAPDPGAPAFWPWLRAFSGPVAHACGLSGELLRIDPSGESAVVELFAAVSRAGDRLLSAATGAAAGIVVVLEDLHWADGASFQLLRYVCSEISGSRLLVVATVRDGLLEGLSGLDRAVTLRLAALTSDEVKQCLPGGTHPSWAAELHRRTGGNPLYLTELTRLLDPEALRLPPNPAWPVPGDLSRSVASRLHHLPERCRRLLDGASVAGEEFDLDVIGSDADAVAEAVAARVLVEDPASPGRLRWSHTLVREAWYEQLTREVRIEWHRRLAERLQRSGTRYTGEIAHHQLRAAADDSSRRAAVLACEAAAEAASAELDYTGAGYWHAQALPLLRDDDARGQTLLSMGRAAFHAGRVMEALDHCQRAATIAEQLRRVDLLADAAVVVRGVSGLPAGPIAGLCERARAALGGEQSARHAKVLAQHARALADTSDLDAARPVSEQAMSMAADCGDVGARLEAMHARHEVIGGLDGIGERLSLGAEMIRLASAAARLEAALWGHLWRVDAHLQRGASSELLAELFDLAALADRLGWPLARWHLLRAQATRAIQTGRFDEAAGLALQCQQVAVHTQDDAALVQSHLVMTELQTLTGRYAEHASPPLDWDHTAPQWLPVSYATYGWHELQAGRVETAQAMFEQVRSRLATLPVDARWAPTIMRAGEVAAALGDARTAHITYRLLLPHAQHYVGQSAAYLGAIPRTLGVLASFLGDHDAAVTHGTAAVAMEQRAGAVPFAALAQLAHARSLLARGAPRDRNRASTLLEACLATASRLAMKPAAAAASTLLGELRGLSPGPVTLTPREREIVEFLIEGVSNQLIAHRLVLSERTVETHVRNILAKLDLTNRTQIARWALDAQLRGEDTWQH